MKHFLVGLIAAFSLVGCSNRAAAEHFAMLARSVMIANGTCLSSSDCITKNLVFSDARIFSGIEVSVFNTNNPAAIAAIEQNFRQGIAQQPGAKVSLIVYSSPFGADKPVKLHTAAFQ